MDKINIDYGMRNDYMFRAVLQENTNVLKGLVSALLHLDPEKDVKSITVTNPIKIGETIDDKEFVLDLAVLLNDDKYINLEMQVINHHNWPERSLSYLCRSFDQLNKGDAYEDAKPVIHIGFLDYSPFPDSDEFYSRYELLNVKTHEPYTRKFAISVIDLTQIKNATIEDQAYGIDKWAALFKATTWEEVNMITQDNKYLSEAGKTIWEYNEDEMIRQKCEARRRAEIEENHMKNKIKTLTEANDALASVNDALTSEISALTSENGVLASENGVLASENGVLTSENYALNSRISEMESIIANLTAQLNNGKNSES